MRPQTRWFPDHHRTTGGWTATGWCGRNTLAKSATASWYVNSFLCVCLTLHALVSSFFTLPCRRPCFPLTLNRLSNPHAIAPLCKISHSPSRHKRARTHARHSPSPSLTHARAHTHRPMCSSRARFRQGPHPPRRRPCPIGRSAYTRPGYEFLIPPQFCTKALYVPMCKLTNALIIRLVRAEPSSLCQAMRAKVDTPQPQAVKHGECQVVAGQLVQVLWSHKQSRRGNDETK